MRKIEELQTAPHLCINGRVSGMGADKYQIYHGWVEWAGFKGTVIFGYDENDCMEHVSVSPMKRSYVPSWDDMCRLKDMFFYPDEMVVQIHPAENRYVHGVGGPKGRLENVLHLWRPMDGDFSILNHPDKWD